MALAALLLLAATASVRAGSNEYTLKAQALYRFMQYVDWPADENNSDFVLAVLGKNPFGEALSALPRSLAGRPLLIKPVASARQAGGGRTLLFVAASEAPRLKGILADLSGSSVLSVGESSEFARQGGCIGFVISGGRLRFEINRGALQRAGLKASSNLLRLGILVGGTPDDPLARGEASHS